MLLLQNKFVCYCLDGIEFVDSTKPINLNLIKDGLEITDNLNKQLYTCYYKDINDVKIDSSGKDKILNIQIGEKCIRLFKPIITSVETIKEMILKCIEDKDNFFTEYEKQQEQQKKLNAKIGNVFLWIIGIFFILSIFSLKECFISELFKVFAGILILPPSYNLLKKYINILDSKKIRVWSIIILIIASIIFMPHTTTAYIKSNDTIICSEPSADTGVKRLNVLNKVEVYKNNYATNGFLKMDDGNWVKEDSIVFPESSEYKNIVKQEEERKAEAEKIKNELEKLINEEQEKAMKELEVNIKKVFANYDIKEYSFTYYIHPLIWYNTDLKQKENIMKNCAIYGKLKSGQKNTELDVSLAQTKIKSSTNGEILGEYNIFSGFKFK